MPTITVISSPNANQPAFNQIIYDVSSTMTAQSNFNFLADVYVDSVLVSRLLFPKQPSVTNIKMDLSPVLRNYVLNDIENVYTALFAANTLSRAKYFVQFGDVYDVSGIPTIHANDLRSPTSGTKQAMNQVFDFEDFTPAILASYNVNNNHLLSSIPETINIEPGQRLIVSFYDPSLVITRVGISNQAGSPPLAFTAVTEVAGEFLYNVNIGKLINDFDAYAGSSYTIFLSDASFIRTYFTVTVTAACSKFETVRLHWLNHFGGWDSFNFTKLETQNTDIDRVQFKKIMPLGYDVNDRLKTNYNTTLTDNLVVNSDWISDNMARWIEDLFFSPIVLLERSSTMIPVQLTDPNYLRNKYLNGRQLHNIQFTIQYSYNRYRQSL